MLREHMNGLVDARDDALMRADLAMSECAALEQRVAELKAELTISQDTNQQLFSALSRLRTRAIRVENKLAKIA